MGWRWRRQGGTVVLMNRVKAITRPRVVLAVEEGGFDVVGFLTFFVGILNAVDGLLQRKAQRPET